MSIHKSRYGRDKGEPWLSCGHTPTTNLPHRAKIKCMVRHYYYHNPPRSIKPWQSWHTLRPIELRCYHHSLSPTFSQPSPRSTIFLYKTKNSQTPPKTYWWSTSCPSLPRPCQQSNQYVLYIIQKPNLLLSCWRLSLGNRRIQLQRKSLAMGTATPFTLASHPQHASHSSSNHG